jgi:hypothetical protein
MCSQFYSDWRASIFNHLDICAARQLPNGPAAGQHGVQIGRPNGRQSSIALVQLPELNV